MMWQSSSWTRYNGNIVWTQRNSLYLLLKALEFSEDIQPICLPEESYPSSDFMNRYAVTIQGWGQDEDGVAGEQLTQIDLTIRKNAICNAKYKNLDATRISYYFPNLTIPSMFCADGNLKTDTGTCYGDSGGPSLIK